MKKRILVAYASVSGSTGDVAEAIGKVIEQHGVTVDVAPVKDVFSVQGYNGVVVGSSIRAGRWLPEAVRFLREHQENLPVVPVAYFTTCLTMVNDTPDNRQIVRSYLEPILQTIPEIEPVGLGLFAGSLDPHRQLIMQSQSPVHGDYRNWEAIRQWAEEVTPGLLSGEVFEEPIILRETIISYIEAARADKAIVDLHEANLHHADLSQLDLLRSDLRKANLMESNLRGVNLIGADLYRADLRWANLHQATLNGANLANANLSGADLRLADLNWADLSGADLSRANLKGAKLGWTNLSEADLSQVHLQEARFNSQTQWPPGFSPTALGAILVERM